MTNSKHSVAFGNRFVAYGDLLPNIKEEVVFTTTRVHDIRSGNLSLPAINPAMTPEVLSFVCLHSLAGYSMSREVLGTADEYGFQTHFHSMMQNMAQCCPVEARDGGMNAIEASGYRSDRLALDASITTNSPGGEGGAQATATAAAWAAASGAK